MHFMCETQHMQAGVHMLEISVTNNYTLVVNMSKYIIFCSESNFNRPGVPAFGQRVPSLKILNPSQDQS